MFDGYDATPWRQPTLSVGDVMKRPAKIYSCPGDPANCDPGVVRAYIGGVFYGFARLPLPVANTAIGPGRNQDYSIKDEGGLTILHSAGRLYFTRPGTYEARLEFGTNNGEFTPQRVETKDVVVEGSPVSVSVDTPNTTNSNSQATVQASVENTLPLVYDPSRGMVGTTITRTVGIDTSPPAISSVTPQSRDITVQPGNTQTVEFDVQFGGVVGSDTVVDVCPTVG